jgi:hypothetical protein
MVLVSAVLMEPVVAAEKPQDNSKRPALSAAVASPEFRNLGSRRELSDAGL